MASADERKSNRGNEDHKGGDPQGLRGVTLNGQGATPKGGRMRFDDDGSSVCASGLMEGKASGSEPDEGIRELTRAIIQDVLAELSVIPKPLAGVAKTLAPGRLLALMNVSPLGLRFRVLANAPGSIGLLRKIEQRMIADRANLPRNVDDRATSEDTSWLACASSTGRLARGSGTLCGR